MKWPFMKYFTIMHSGCASQYNSLSAQQDIEVFAFNFWTNKIAGKIAFYINDPQVIRSSHELGQHWSAANQSEDIYYTF